MEQAEGPTCKNCGAVALSKFCPECGQSTSVTVPTILGFFHDAFAAVASYDSRLWRSIRVLLTRPGELTCAYISGVRARYLSPFQLFFWLQAITFFVNRRMFDNNTALSDAKSRDLMLVGGAVTFAFAALYGRHHRKFVEHLVFTTHLWSFMMVVLLFEYATLPYIANLIAAQFPTIHFQVGITATLIALAAMILYSPTAMVRVYKDKAWKAIIRTALLVSLWYGLELLFQRFLHPGIRV